jgi:signal transduction histidine kinase/ActR/RegA family two-component response regulator
MRKGDKAFGVLVVQSYSETIRYGARDKEILNFVGQHVATAIEHKRAENALRQSEKQLWQSQKMEAVGRLAGGVAHDFNNLLTVIKGYTELMLEELKPSDPMRAEMDEVQKAADRAATLTRQLLAFSRRQVLAPKVVNLNYLVEDMNKLLRRLLGEDIELCVRLADNLGSAKADPGQIEQVIMNLAVNARDAMPRGGKLTLETANIELDAAYSRQHAPVVPGSYVMLAITDTGSGIDAETLSHVFEPFFTTKEQGKGTGLGLSTVYGIVKQSGGYIWPYSEPGMGTSFKIYLPRVAEKAERAQARAQASSGLGGTETILLVEDEEGVRGLTRQILQRHGYTVLEAEHGQDALRLCERYSGPIHLLLSDVVLAAQMSGRELVQHLAPLRREMKVLYMSGYSDEAIVHHGVLEPGTAFLQKPFTTESLMRKLREVLDPKKIT